MCPKWPGCNPCVPPALPSGVHALLIFLLQDKPQGSLMVGLHTPTSCLSVLFCHPYATTDDQTNLLLRPTPTPSHTARLLRLRFTVKPQQ